MAKEKLIVIKQASLTNNCPECFNQDLTLTFFQKHNNGSFFHDTTTEVSHTLVCTTCHSKIYPSSWTEDIERMFNYYEKTAIPEKASSKPTNLFYILSVLLVIATALVYAYLEEVIQF